MNETLKFPASAPMNLRGLWDREALSTPAGHRDETTRTLWLQTRRAYADIRVTADRPVRPRAKSFRDYSDQELIALAKTQGFAGVLDASGGVCFWHRHLDYQPRGDTPDEARYEIVGDRMEEFGIHSEYTEIWRRTPGTIEPLLTFQRQGGAGLLVVAGEHFIEIRDRAHPLPAGASLSTIVKADLAAGRRDLAESRLDMRICYGRIASGGGPWRVELSSFPWLEGGSLFGTEIGRIDVGSGTLIGEDGEAWRLVDAELPEAGPARPFAA